MNIWQKINSYKKFIQKMVNALPEADSVVIFRGLLEEYDDNLSQLSDVPLTITTLVNILSNEVNKKEHEKDIIDIIDPYLKENPIDNNSEFFAVLIAYFYYFEDLYANKDLHDRAAFYQQILIPLHLYREELEKDLVKNALLQADKNIESSGPSFFRLGQLEPKYHWLACEILRSIAIPKNELPSVVNKMLEKLDQVLMTDEACKTLANIPIPVDQQERVVTKLLSIARTRYREEAYDTLMEVPIPKDLRDQVVATLQDAIYKHDINSSFAPDIVNKCAVEEQLENVISRAFENTSYENEDVDRKKYVRTRACEILGIVGRMSPIDEPQREKIIDKLLEIADDPEMLLYTAAFSALANMPIPKSRQEKVVIKLLEKVDSENSICSGYACQALGKVPIPKEQQEAVITKLEYKLERSNTWFVCETLGEVPIPEKHHHNIFNKMTDKADDLNTPIGKSACRTLIKLAVTENDYERMTTKILEKLDSQNPSIFIAVCQALKRTEIPTKYCKRIIEKLLTKNSDSDVIKDHICQTLAALPIPETLQPQVVRKLLKTAIYLVSRDAETFAALGKVPIPENQIELVITKLRQTVVDIVYSSPVAKISACEALGKIKINSKQSLVIFSKLFNSVLTSNNAFEELRETLQTTLLALYEKLTLLDRIKIVVTLESQQEYVANKSPEKLPFLLSLIQSCQSKNVLYSSLISHLPVEQAASAIEVIMGKGPR